MLAGDATAKTLTSKIGAGGAEAPDPNFGAAGVIDLTAAAYDTLAELKTSIDGYDDYICEIFYGDEDIVTENILDLEVQAKSTGAYVLFLITSVLASYALVSWEFVKEILELADELQTRCERLINAASTSANRITDRFLKAAAYSKTLDGNGKDSLLLSDYPVNSITELNIDTGRAFGASTEITDYLLYPETGLIRMDSAVFPAYSQCVKVVFNAGFSPVPDDLQLAVAEVVAYNLGRFGGKGNLIGVKNLQAQSMIVTSYELTIPVNAQRVFESYRRAG